MLNAWSLPMGAEWTWLWQNLVSRRRLNMKFMSSRTYLHSSGVIIAPRDEELKILTNAWRWKRAESALPVVAFDFCFIKTSGSVSGVVADEGATCLALVDVDTGYLKVVPAAANTVTDYLVEGRRFIEQVFRRRVRLRCDGEPATVALAGTLKDFLFDLVVWKERRGMTVQRIPRNVLSGRLRNKSR